MGTKYRILIMGASYGSLLGTKLALAGHSTHLFCLPAEADLINKEGAIVRMPVKGRDGLVEINSKKLPGKMTAGGTAGVKPSDYDLVALAMQSVQDHEAPGAPRRADHQQRLHLGPRAETELGPVYRDQARDHRPHQGDRSRRPQVRHRVRPDRHRECRDRDDGEDEEGRSAGERVH